MSSDEKVVSQLKEMIGIIGFEMVNTVVDDLFTLLSKRTEQNYLLVEAALDGYILALSRIVESKVGWKCISEVFEKNNTSIPSKYYKLFNETEPDSKKETVDDSVSDASRPISEQS